MENFLLDLFNLHNEFGKTRPKKWSIMQLCCELNVQVGQLGYLIINKDNELQGEFVGEVGRNINSIPDELSDCILQVGTIVKILDLNLKKFVKRVFKKRRILNKNTDLMLYSQLSCLSQRVLESSMRIDGYKFVRELDKFYNSNEKDFLIDQITRITAILLTFIKRYKIKFMDEFYNMRSDARKFLKDFDNYIAKKEDIRQENIKLLTFFQEKMLLLSNEIDK